MLWTPLLLMLWKSLSLGKLVLMSMIFLVPQACRRKFTLMILCLLYMMITMMIMLFSVHLLLRRKLIMITKHPIFDDYDDENNNDCYFVEFSPTPINKNDYAYVESINSFMQMNHDKIFSGDGYIVDFIKDATESY